MTDDLTADDTPVTVCMRHYRFVPCRRCSEPTPGFWSTEPADIDLVRRVQQRRTPPAPDLGLRERLTAVVHNTLATGDSDTDVADAILAMPEMDAIRLQLGYMANSLAVGCNDDVNHGESMTDTLSEYLDPALITWVLGCHDPVCNVCEAADEIQRLRESSNRWQATAAGLSEDISNAEDEIEWLRAAGDALAERLRWWADNTDAWYRDHRVLQRWEEVCRG